MNFSLLAPDIAAVSCLAVVTMLPSLAFWEMAIPASSCVLRVMYLGTIPSGRVTSNFRTAILCLKLISEISVPEAVVCAVIKL